MAAAYIAALIPALVIAVTQPVWSRVDEAQHTDFIVQLSHGVYPIADQTLITPEVLRVMQQTGIFRGAPKGSYPLPDISDIAPPPQGMSLAANAVWMSRHMWQLSFESVQTPVYYVLMVPVWWIANLLGGPFAAIYAIRIIDAFLVAALAPMAVAVARILAPSRREVAGMAAIFAILLPGLDLNGTRIGNDGAGAVLGGLVVLLAVRWAGSMWTWRRTVLLGLALGAALMVKLTVGGVIPAVVLAMLWPVPDTTWRRRLQRAVVAQIVAVTCLVPWFLVNLQHYGALLRGASVGRLSDGLPSPFTAAFVPFDIGVFVLTYWTGEPFGTLPFSAAFALLGALLGLLAVAGIVRLLRLRLAAMPIGPFAVALVAVAGMCGVALGLPATAGFEFAGPGRYAYPALPAAAALTGLGICTALTMAAARRAVTGLYAVAAAGILAAIPAGWPGDIDPGSGMPPADARILSASSAGELQGVAIHVDRIALDQTQRGTWIEVTVTNRGSQEAEWTVTPVVSHGGDAAIGEYVLSTHLPGDIEAGRTVGGWLFVPLDPTDLHPGTAIHVRFANVAVNGYRAVGDIELDVPL